MASSPEELQIGANNLAVIFGTLATVLAVAGFVVGLCQYFRMSGSTRATSSQEDLKMQRMISQNLHSTLTPPTPSHTDATVAGMQTIAPTLPYPPAASLVSMHSQPSSSPVLAVGGQTNCENVNNTATSPPSYRASQQPIEHLVREGDTKEEGDARLRTSFRTGTNETAESNGCPDENVVAALLEAGKFRIGLADGQ
ncbi:hypothetical protein LTR27_012473 [Elasticomyces elasticus]|nr:hypothetical protein LTR27_012473 [Elasticomyces elasticus]